MRLLRSMALSVAGLALSTSGCGLAVVAEADLPAEMQALLADAARFRATGTHALQSAAPGEQRDNLGDLTGCWGTWFEEDASMSLVEAFVFAPDGSFERQSAVVGPVGALLAVTVERGAYEVLSPALLVLRTESIESIEPGGASMTIDLDPAVERRSLITRDGDALLIFLGADSAADLAAEGPRGVTLPLDCP